MENNQKKWRRLEVFLEFLIFGIIVGVAEDLIAVKIVSDITITWSTVGLVVLISIPFAIVGEVLVDRIDFVELFSRYFAKRKNKNLSNESS